MCSCRLYEVETTFETVKTLSYEFIRKLTTCNKKTSEAVDRALSLLFYTAEKFESGARVAGAGNRFDKSIKDMWDRLKKVIANDWIAFNFTPMFGEYAPETVYRRAGFPKAEKEIMVNSIFMIVFEIPLSIIILYPDHDQ